MQDKSSPLVDELVEHPEDPLLALAEVIGIYHVGRPVLQIDYYGHPVGHIGELKPRGHDEPELRSEGFLQMIGGFNSLPGESQNLLHPGHVRALFRIEALYGDCLVPYAIVSVYLDQLALFLDIFPLNVKDLPGSVGLYDLYRIDTSVA